MARYYFKIYNNKQDLEVRSGGLRFLFFYAVVLLASINTGNNLLYLVLSTLTAAVIVSWFMASASLRGLNVKIEMPEDIHAGEESTLTFFVEKTGALFAGQSLTFTLRSQGKPRLHLPFIDVLDRNSSEKIQGLVTYPQRGRQALNGVEVSSTYPFGIIKRSKTFPSPGHVLILPHILPLENIVRLGMEGMHSLDSVFRGHGGGLLNIRPFQAGDDPRNLHWKATARTDQLMVMEMARQKGHFLFIHFNPFGASAHREEDKDLFETGVSVAASLVYHGDQDGLEMILSAPGRRLSPAEPQNYVNSFFHYLAEVSLKRTANVPKASLEKRRHDEFTIIVDPLNSDLDWGPGTIVLDREYMKELQLSGGAR